MHNTQVGSTAQSLKTATTTTTKQQQKKQQKKRSIKQMVFPLITHFTTGNFQISPI